MRKDTRPTLRPLIAAAGLAIALATPATTLAQPAPPPTAIASPTGFAAVRFPMDPVEGPIALAATRAWVWSDAQGSAGPVSRLLLDGEVTVQLGGYRFRARRAVLWLRTVEGAPGTYQVFANLFDVGSPEADAAVGFEATRLPIHGLVTTTSGPSLDAALVQDGPPTRSDDLLAALTEAERALESLLERLAGPAALPPPEPPLITDPDAQPPPPATSPIFEADGVLYLSPGERITTESGRDANTITITGGVAIQYAGPTRSLELTARRAVVFLRPGPLKETLSRLDVRDVLGVYLEGGVVATDGEYTIRGPRVYYDLPTDRALILDAVFRTYDARMNTPLYLRAAAIRQEAANQFTADRAKVANTAFARPHLALGTSTVTIERREQPDGRTTTYADARNVTPTINGVPFFYLPRFQGDPERIPLKNIGFEDSNRQGFTAKTEWDPFVLLGIETPRGLGSTLLADYYSDRGLALGLAANWGDDTQRGNLFLYGLMDDDGTDILKNGTALERDGDFRGAIVARQQAQLSPLWKLTLEGSYVSDETFYQAFDPVEGEQTFELTNRLHLRRLEGNTITTIEAKAAANDFIVAEHQFQSPGYRVDKLPEIEVKGIATDLTKALDPGLVSYTWEYGFTSQRLRFTEIAPQDLGIGDNRLFGLPRGTPIAEAFRSQGLTEDIVNRFDTRHELAMPLNAGPISFTPFVVGRFTAYDSDFTGFSPNETDNARLWGAAGVRLGTSFFKVDDSVESRTFDLHRIRHIIEPGLVLWHADSTLASNDLPVFDDDVEPLAEGNAARLELVQTWQTQRGGPGRWRSVDVLTVTMGATWAEREADRGGPVPRWYDARPELSSTRRALDLAGVWRVSEVVALAGETVYDTEVSQMARSSAGVIIDQGRGLRFEAELRSLRSQGDTYGDMGLSYLFSDKYYTEAGFSYNFELSTFASSSLTVLRRFPNGELGLTVVYDNIGQETSFGFVFRPTGIRGNFGVSGFGGAQSGGFGS